MFHIVHWGSYLTSTNRSGLCLRLSHFSLLVFLHPPPFACWRSLLPAVEVPVAAIDFEAKTPHMTWAYGCCQDDQRTETETSRGSTRRLRAFESALEARGWVGDPESRAIKSLRSWTHSVDQKEGRGFNRLMSICYSDFRTKGIEQKRLEKHALETGETRETQNYLGMDW